ncbi:MAG: hypothetical protein ABI620_05645 [Chloroflexota bacterium]
MPTIAPRAPWEADTDARTLPAQVGATPAALDDPIGWPDAAAALVATLGFQLLGDGSGDGGSGSSQAGHLVVAMRDRPTLRHFDPESITFYGPEGDGSAPITIRPLLPGARSTQVVRWGHVHVTDRLPVENRFLTFGGELRLAALADGLTIALLRSPAPIVRWGGHSQGTDSLAGAIGAFFGRLIVPVDFTPGAAARIDAMPPHVLFTAFLRDAAHRLRSREDRGGEASELDRWLAAAWARAREDEPVRAAAESLLNDLRI